MTASTKRARLEAEKAQLAALLSSYGDDDFLARMGFEQRMAEVVSELSEISEATQTGLRAETDLTFYGGPVSDSDGIEADFAAKVIASFQELVSNTSSGALRDPHLSRMHITGVLHGSFGFQLRELSEHDLAGPSPLFEAVEGAAQLIDAAGRDDEAFVDAVQELRPRAQDAVRIFFQTIHSANATFRLASSKLRTEFTTDRITAAVERVTATHHDEYTEDLQAVYLGSLHGSRSFEVQLLGGQVIKGKAGANVDLQALDPWNLRPCIARISTRAWKRGGRVYRRYYTLLELLPDPARPLSE